MNNQSIIEQHVDIPPSFFDFDEPGVNEVAPVAPKAAKAFKARKLAEDLTVVDMKKPIAIARAVSGVTEVRLLVGTREGKSDVYFLEEAQLQPYTTVPEVIKGKKGFTQDDALAIFLTKVAEKYPVEVLRNQKEVARHAMILFPHKVQ